MSSDTTRWQLFANPAAAQPMPGGLDVHAQQAIIRAAFKPERRFGYDYLLLCRYGLVNLVGVALLTAGYFQGWIHAVAAADTTFLCAAIAGVFLAGLFICTGQVLRVSRELNEAFSDRPSPDSRAGQYLSLAHGRGGDSRSILASSLRAKLMARTTIVRHFAGTLVILGLIGTVIGFIIALSGVRPDVAADAQVVTPMIAKLIQGMSVALYTTLVGAVLNVWLMVNHHVLAAGTMHLVTAIVERGEADVAE